MFYIPIVDSKDYGREEYASAEKVDEAVACLSRVKKKADELDDDVDREYLIRVEFDEDQPFGEEPQTAIEALSRETDTPIKDWEEIDGPDSGVGVDHWFRNKETGREAYVNEDQGEFTVSAPANDGC